MASNAWLAKRTRGHVDSLMPKIATALADKGNSAQLDLATAENHLIRAELLDVCKDAIDERLRPETFSYPSGFGGEPFLLRALSNFFNEYFQPHVPVDSSHIVAGPGATACLSALLCGICDLGDAVLVPGTYWNGFDLHFRLQPGVDIINAVPEGNAEDEMGSGLLPSLVQAANAAERDEKKVRALVLTNPHNPSGRCYTADALKMTATFCEERDIHFIVDEVYALSCLRTPGRDDPAFMSALSVDLASLDVNIARVHVVWSTSKDFGSSGFRMGCVISQGNAAVRTSIGLVTTTQTSALAAIVTAGVLESIQLPRLIKMNSQRLSEAYTRVTDWLKRHGLPFVPATGGVYVFARLAPHAQTWADEDEMIARLRAARVLVSPGRSFHSREDQKGWARIVIAVEPHILTEALTQIELALKLGRAGIKRAVGRSDKGTRTSWKVVKRKDRRRV